MRGGVAETALQAYERAFATDPLSAFGGVIAFNRAVDEATERCLAEQFVEVLFAPGYEEGVLRFLDNAEGCHCSRTTSAARRSTAEPRSSRSMAGRCAGP